MPREDLRPPRFETRSRLRGLRRRRGRRRSGAAATYLRSRFSGRQRHARSIACSRSSAQSGVAVAEFSADRPSAVLFVLGPFVPVPFVAAPFSAAHATAVPSAPVPAASGLFRQVRLVNRSLAGPSDIQNATQIWFKRLNGKHRYAHQLVPERVRSYINTPLGVYAPRWSLRGGGRVRARARVVGGRRRILSRRGRPLPLSRPGTCCCAAAPPRPDSR
jgi:hypothetical protein